MKSSPLLSLILILFLQIIQPSYSDAPPTCSTSGDDENVDPALKEMTFDLGYGQEVFEAYVQPSIESFSQGKFKEVKRPSFQGIAGKFFNMGPDKVRLYWDSGIQGVALTIIASCLPFESVGTATFPGHQFLFTPASDPSTELIRFFVIEDQNNYFYDPIHVPNDPVQTTKNHARLTYAQYEKYEKQRRNRLFHEHYRNFTGHDYLSLYPRAPPLHKMWRANYFGQEHWVTTRETHFTDLPPEHLLTNINEYGTKRILKEADPRLLSQYRSAEPTMNMTLRVISCAPRAFEIVNFLSDVEVNHVLKLSGALGLKKSTTSGSHEFAEEDSDDSSIKATRTSYNTWVSRELSPIVDSIYRRAADLLRIDEALMRFRGDGEYAHLGTERSIAESLQLVHYDPGQEYTAHHDFGYSRIDSQYQEARFSTLLLYLNDGMEGGETEFPRWVNGETHEGLKTVPQKGKAILFYNQLPDGNMDDLSQHAALPVTKGDKWLMNLWVWDPVYEH